MTRIKFKSLSSGSCGNCYYLGIFSEEGACLAAILIDAGVSPRRLKKELEREGLDIKKINGILITHDHHDHIGSLGSYCKHYHIPVWTHPYLSEALSRRRSTEQYFPNCSHVMGEGWNEITPDGLVRARCFELPHDASHTVGYAISLDGYKLVIMTDLGRMTIQAGELASQADTVIIESNYDPYMLEHGPYPRELKDRIRNGHGHLSNQECAAAISNFDHDSLKHVFMCHLSEHNNTPELAMSVSRPILRPEVRLCPLPRMTPSPMFVLR